MAKRPRRTIALDFDGVLHRYDGYKEGALDGPIEGAKQAVEQLLKARQTVVVFTTRDNEAVRDWLAEHGFPPLEVTSVKRPFYVIVDDRAITFDGRWNEDAIQAILKFEPYWIATRREGLKKLVRLTEELGGYAELRHAEVAK